MRHFTHKAIAPTTGAWIEINRSIRTNDIWLVAPHTGAWIEIIGPTETTFRAGIAHPTWVRGLKFLIITDGVVGSIYRTERCVDRNTKDCHRR